LDGLASPGAEFGRYQRAKHVMHGAWVSDMLLNAGRRVLSSKNVNAAVRSDVACRPWHSGEYIVLSLILAALFFIGIHLGIAGTVIRDRDRDIRRKRL
jgi:hypothetical protein